MTDKLVELICRNVSLSCRHRLTTCSDSCSARKRPCRPSSESSLCARRYEHAVLCLRLASCATHAVGRECSGLEKYLVPYILLLQAQGVQKLSEDVAVAEAAQSLQAELRVTHKSGTPS